MIAAVLLGLVSCGKGRDHGSSVPTATAPAEAGPPGPPPAGDIGAVVTALAGTAQPMAAIPDSVPDEVHYPGAFYRALGGEVTVGLGGLPGGFDSELRGPPAGASWDRGLLLRSDGGGAMVVRIEHPVSGAADAGAVVDALAKELEAAVPASWAPVDAQEKLADGRWRALRGRVGPGDVIVGLGAVAHGPRAVAAIAIAGPLAWDSGACDALLALLGNVRIGDRVATMTDRAPSVRLDGIYAGEHHWYTFDRRGYVLEGIPYDAFHLDLEAQNQSSPGLLSAYSVKGRTLTIDSARGARTLTVSRDGDTLVLDGEQLVRVDHPGDHPAHWNASFRLASATPVAGQDPGPPTWELHADGHYTYRGGAPSPAVGPEPHAGTYELDGIRLHLHPSPDRDLVVPFFVGGALTYLAGDPYTTP